MRDFLMRIMRFHIVFSMGSRFWGLGSFWVFFGVSREHLWDLRGTHWSLSWVTLRTLGVLGVLLGASWDPSGAQLGDFVPSWEPCVANLCICVVILFPLGSGVASSILGLRIKFFVLSLEATGWVCRYWWSRFRSRLNCIPNGWMLLHQLGDFVSLGARCGFWFVNKIVCPIFRGQWLSLWILAN